MLLAENKYSKESALVAGIIKYCQGEQETEGRCGCRGIAKYRSLEIIRCRVGKDVVFRLVWLQLL